MFDNANYSIACPGLLGTCNLPLLKPLKIYKDLALITKSVTRAIMKKRRSYGFIFKGESTMQYIGSSQNLYDRKTT